MTSAVITRRQQIERKLRSMSQKERERLALLATPRLVEPYIAHIPHPTQQVFLSLNQSKEVLFGGAAGGGKSDALLMAALQYVDVPGYSALILRRTWPDLVLAGAIMDRANAWLEGTPAKKKDGGRLWVFPSGAKLQFGYLQHDNQKHRYASAEFQFIGFDELTQFAEERTYDFLFSRLRRPALTCLNCSEAVVMYRKERDRNLRWRHSTRFGRNKCGHVFPDPKVLAQYPPAEDGTYIFDVPLRMRSASNPGAKGHEWVKARFVEPKTRRDGTIFVPSTLKDNPSIDREAYLDSLSHLNLLDRMRLEDGDWDAVEKGDFFSRDDFTYVNKVPSNITKWMRFWDLAATENSTSDWTVGTLVGVTKDNRFVVVDVVRLRGHPNKVEDAMFKTAQLDTVNVPIRYEEEGGSAGKIVTAHIRRNVLPGFNFDGIRSTGSKEARARSFSSYSKGEGNVLVVLGKWNREWINELEAFPGGSHDDQVDSVSSGFNHTMTGRRARILV